MLFFPGWSTLLAGYLVSAGGIYGWSEAGWNGFFINLWRDQIALGMIAFMAAMGASFIMNQLHDVESDRENNKLFLLGENYVTKPAAMVESILLIIFSLGLSSLINSRIVFLNFLFILVTGYLYNFPPFQYKNRPLLGLYLNIFMGWIAFALGWSLLRQLDWSFFISSLPYVFLNTGLYLLTTMPDADGDRASDKSTFCVRYGLKTTIRSSMVFYFLSILTGMFLGDYLILSIDLLVVYWAIRLILGPSVANAIKMIKMSIFFFSALISLKFPLYFLLMLIVFFVTKYYYRVRFQFDYPNFRGE